MPGDGQRLISQYWDTAEVPPYVQELCSSFRDLNPELRHRVFSEAGAEGFIENRFGPREVAAFRGCAVPSMQSDYFRYCVVLALGGIYADADFHCIRSLSPLLEGPQLGEIFLGPTPLTVGGKDATRVWSGFFAFKEPGHPFLELALEIATANMEERIAERVWPAGEKVVEGIWLTVGPGIFSLMRFLRDWGSFDALTGAAAGTDAEPFAELLCEVVEDYDRIVEAFHGMRVSSFDDMETWIARPHRELPYKATEVHWKNVTTSIFR